MTTATPSLLRLFVETAGLLLAATALAITVNALSPVVISITRPLSLKEIDARFLTAEETKAFHDSGQSIFLDARRNDEFNRGHIAGALNFPAEEFTQRFVGLAPMLPQEVTMIVYCGGSDCDQSRMLADRLAQMGYRDLKIFHGGWREWQKRGWPAE